eukprot:CAMPEP_0202685598 /NCGR_PEP_ID=MMETSP1385-20130828/1404_1 /ASSEMBLY_ACC=CAM_ASM_000861 /TAXON_ID=933848 /ORGANISM="Elphidium margaritaceum" /LENGTH=212 /DNA_ID=CAMNT_0049339993 /DNA_START=28 /DNA_END=666 /DNA_ORIENTATION=+
MASFVKFAWTTVLLCSLMRCQEQLETTALPPATVFMKTCQAITSCCTEKVGAGGRCMIYDGCQADYFFTGGGGTCGNETGHADPDWVPITIQRGDAYNVSMERPTERVEQDGVHNVEVDEDGCIWLDGELMIIHNNYRLEEFICIRWDGMCTWECAMWLCTNSQRCIADKSGRIHTNIEPVFPGTEIEDDASALSLNWSRMCLMMAIALMLY